MIKKLIQFIGGHEQEMQERLLRSIVFIAGIATIVGIAEIFFVIEITPIMVPMLILLFLAMCFVELLTFKYRKYKQAAILLGLAIIVILFPIMFFLSAALEGGAAIWMTLGILYIFTMFSGKLLFVFFGLSLLSYVLTYAIAYHMPEVVVPMAAQANSYIDSLFSIFAVGIIAGCIIKMQIKIYNTEHQLNLQQQEMMENDSKAKDVFFANISHEIRTPINVILGMNEMILRDAHTNEVREYAQNIQNAGNMLLNQVNDILDVSRMEVDKMQLMPVSYRLKDVLSDLSDMVHVQAEKKGLNFYLDIDANLPSVLEGDEKRLKQILLNILDNAVKYTEEGNVTLSVYGEGENEDEVKLTFKIADTGIGIRKESLAVIFEAFNRFDEERNRNILGSGLGLTITHRLVQLMGGEISVDSIYRKGTIFTVVLKQKIVSAEPMGEVSCFGGMVEEWTEYKPLFRAPEARILIVDDSNMNRMVAERLLSATNVQIDMASGGAECLEKTKKKYYHAILLDYMMPDMDGLETLNAIRNQENGLCREAPIISLTGNVVSETRQQYLDRGFDGYVGKPIQGKLLEREVLSFLPMDIVEYRDESYGKGQGEEQTPWIYQRKRKKIYITADCTCDIPAELLEKYDIKLMYLYIKTPHGRFADTREIDSDSMAYYVEAESTTARADRTSVAEFEEFFAAALTEAEEIIHVTMASKVGSSYRIATEAAKCFGHVHVIDSGHISCGQGLVTLCAARLAAEGKTVTEICDAVNKMKKQVHTSFVLPGADIFYQSGRVKPLFRKICNIFLLHPYGGMRHSGTQMYALLGGSLENAWRKAISYSFIYRRKINTRIVFVTHVGCSVKQQDKIRRELLKRVPFKQVITNKASFTTACSVGMGAVGYAYYTGTEEYL